MAQLTVDIPIDRVKEVLVQLTPQELHAVLAEVQDRLETFQLMKLAESSFAEWLEEDDLYLPSHE